MSVLTFIPTHNYGQKFAISGEVDENCVLLGYYAASSGNSLPTFRNNITDSSSRKKNKKIRKRRRKKERKKEKKPRKWDQHVVPKRREGITTTRCVIT
jgi:hypothetical protein